MTIPYYMEIMGVDRPWHIYQHTDWIFCCFKRAEFPMSPGDPVGFYVIVARVFSLTWRMMHIFYFHPYLGK